MFKQAIMHGGFPFDLKIPQFNETTIMAINEAAMLYADGNKRFNNIDEMFESLDK